MIIKGIDICEQIKYIKENTQFDFSVINKIEFIQFDDQDYKIIKTGSNYKIYYNKQRDIFAALGYLFSHLDILDYEMKRIRPMKDLGYMIDCARNAVPKISTLKKQVLNLSLMGYTYIGLYLEDLFEIKDEPYFGYMRGRYTKEEISDLVKFSSSYGIRVIPYIQTLAHLNAIFKHRTYQDVLDINDILLVDEPKTYDLIEKMLITVKEMFQTNEINIGMDEAWMLGLGKYLNKHGYIDRMSIMLSHLDKVLTICRKYDIKPTMWADMFFHLKGGSYFSKDVTSFDDIKDLIPKDVELMYWDYYHTNKSDYDNKFESLKTLTSNYSFAGGAWKWVGFAPFNQFSETTMYPAIKSAKEANVDHFVVTSWGDNGAEASMFSILPSLFYIADQIYDDNSGERSKFLEALTGYNLKVWMSLDLVNEIYPSKVIKPVNPSKYLLFEDLLLGDPLIKVNQNYKTYYENIVKEIGQYANNNSKYAYIFSSIFELAKVLEIKATLGLDLYNAYHLKDNKKYLKEISEQTIEEVISRITSLHNTHQQQWYQENKLQGYEVQSYRFGGLIHRLREVQTIIAMYVCHKIDKIDMLEEKILNLSSDDDPYNGCIYYNSFQKYVTFGTF